MEQYRHAVGLKFLLYIRYNMIPNVSYVQNQKTGLGVKIIRVRSTGDRLHCHGALEKLKKNHSRRNQSVR